MMGCPSPSLKNEDLGFKAAFSGRFFGENAAGWEWVWTVLGNTLNSLFKLKTTQGSKFGAVLSSGIPDVKFPLWVNGDFHLPILSIQNVFLGLNPPSFFFKAEFGSNPFQASRWDYKRGLGFGISFKHRTIDKNWINGRDETMFINLQGVKAGIRMVEGKMCILWMCSPHRWYWKSFLRAAACPNYLYNSSGHFNSSF